MNPHPQHHLFPQGYSLDYFFSAFCLFSAVVSVSTNGILNGMWKKILDFLNAYVPPILCAVIIFFLSSRGDLPTFSTSLCDFIFKKSSHMVFFGLLSFLTYRAIN